jgi:hypothetical protein
MTPTEFRTNPKSVKIFQHAISRQPYQLTAVQSFRYRLRSQSQYSRAKNVDGVQLPLNLIFAHALSSCAYDEQFANPKQFLEFRIAGEHADI